MNRTCLAAGCGAGAAVLIGALASWPAGSGTHDSTAGAAPTPVGLVRFVPDRDAPPSHPRWFVLGGPSRGLVRDDGFALALTRSGEDAASDTVGATLSFGFSGPARCVEAIGRLEAPLHVVRLGLLSSAQACSALRLVGVAPGVDVVLRSDPEAGARGALAYDLHIADVAALRDFTIEVRGARRLEVAGDGSVSIEVELGDGSTATLVQRPPRTFVRRDGEAVPVDSRAVQRGEFAFGFVARGVEAGEALCVDPGFVWSTYLGGGASDEAHCVHRLADGDLLIGGWAGSLDFPTTPGAFRVSGARDAFLARMSGDGSLLRWSTYIGGRDGEEIDSIDVAPDGGIVIGGWTGSDDFPVTAGAYQRVFLGGGLLADIGDGFVAKLSADGSALVWSTYLGSNGDEFVRRVAVDGDGTVVVAGDTTTDLFPTTPGVVQRVFGSGNLFLPDVFVSRLSADGSSLVWSTYFGGFAQDYCGGLAIASDGSIVFGGLTASNGLPITPGAAQSVLLGFWDGFLARISADATQVLACTFLGGNGYEQVLDIALDPFGDVYCAGRVGGDPASFPVTAGAYQRAAGGDDDGFVARLSLDGKVLRAATLLGGSGSDSCLGLAVLPGGGVGVVGFTAGGGFPVGGAAAQPNYGGGIRDGFVAQLDPELSMARAVSYAGGAAKDVLLAVVATGVGAELVAVGGSFSTDLPVGPSAFQGQNRGDSDAIVLRIDTRPVPAMLVLDRPAVTRGEQIFQPGSSIDAVALRLRNLTGVSVDLESIEFALGGVGDAATDLAGLSVFIDANEDGRVSAGELRIGALTAAVRAADRVRVACARRLAPNEVLPLVAQLESTAGCTPGAEFVTVIDGANAIVARRVDDGRRELVGGLAGVASTARICGARRSFSGDLDADGRADVRDARLLAARIGESAASPDLDPDGDGTISTDDVRMLIARVLVRAPLGPLPESLDLGSLLALHGYDLAQADLSCTLDGRALTRLAASPRTWLFALPPQLLAGDHELVVRDGAHVRSQSTLRTR